MSAFSPPLITPSSNIYNPLDWESSSSGFTQSQANALYLRKTVPDTATAVENFAGGITTSSIETKTTADDLNIGTTNLALINIGTDPARFTDITIGNSSCSLVSPNRISTAEVDCFNPGGALTLANSMTDGLINIGPNLTLGSIYVGAGIDRVSGSVIHIADGDNLPTGANLHLNNGTTNASNTAIMNGSTTSGTCNVMTGLTTSGTVNICTGTGVTQSGKVNISTGSTTGVVTIGNSANSASFKCPIALTYAPSLITGTTQLGYKIAATAGVTTISGATVLSSVALTAGVWVLNGNVRFMAPGTFGEFSITTSTTTLDYTSASVAVGVNGMCLQVTRIVSTTVGVTYNILANSQAGGSVQSVTFNVYRIA
jgi:hypothetical protein